jgi:hypothetical protein
MDDAIDDAIDMWRCKLPVGDYKQQIADKDLLT